MKEQEETEYASKWFLRFVTFALLFKFHNTAVEKSGLHKYKYAVGSILPGAQQQSLQGGSGPPAYAGNRNTVFFTSELSPGMLGIIL